ncbi:MAG: hypothetical protein CL874_04410 [Dehalococcoidales bacterium]|nr:hypothetical protein [Dehalococcoidales bacterium]
MPKNRFLGEISILNIVYIYIVILCYRVIDSSIILINIYNIVKGYEPVTNLLKRRIDDLFMFANGGGES